MWRNRGVGSYIWRLGGEDILPSQRAGSPLSQGGLEALWPRGGLEALWPRGGLEALWPRGGLEALWPRGGLEALLPRGGLEASVPAEGWKPRGVSGVGDGVEGNGAVAGAVEEVGGGELRG